MQSDNSKLFTRTKILIGTNGVNKLQNAKVIIFGVGGVGGAAVEMLARAGVGKFILVDFDKFDETNLNRQLLSTREVIGATKTCIAKERILAINPNAQVITHEIFFDESNWNVVFNEEVDFVIDAIDSVPSKFFLIHECLKQKIPIISSMGAGNKLDPNLVKTGDISKTSGCGLARAIRTRLKQVGISKGLPVVYSTEGATFDKELAYQGEGKKLLVGSISYMPNLFGIHIASYVIKKLSLNN